ncbi:hypothetical protein OG758_48675 [Streptomyces sp. NBC_01474]|uniref:hypothetical protein n=1 Tax=Streptomyces sp. NBC_01474 TaxID=2903880 RepID=UPI002DDC0EF2|nr:hypothetical protein [Streptomyces sp. NBC_01474]WSD92775.1 hypothetical protein OG758_00115 [Streptomyces sp. NBC_01474]WSE01280.1 hypothetical protein OG758_48675 [Streptomyces sp. NBC_01474]
MPGKFHAQLVVERREELPHLGRLEGGLPPVAGAISQRAAYQAPSQSLPVMVKHEEILLMLATFGNLQRA